ncbi:hypothetical protein L198_00060 [Cryptococcus wingfieldii CBS 7118]|uniref:Uncharacterized protein n=1 Tax=Cryptococcus wingfieldii CBS 7118 TaxID=1295528 RepID=A0A1E3K5X3_9TREE|nr:hypothetical protein L198_00060 [Cryptococcus wingfieldii CBS 7118]ODO08336.1 hypothetical protein L198_00060 [Cryptococcus wingfieldii CBS 7118]
MKQRPLWKPVTFGKASLPVTSASTACAVPPTRSDKSTSAGKKSLWEVAHIVLDRDLFDIAPVKYLQISRYHYERGASRIYRHITITPKTIELLHESSDRPASNFLSNFRFTETIAVNDFSLLSSLHATIESLQKAEGVIRKANKAWWRKRNSSSHQKAWTLPLFPKAHSLKMPQSSFLQAGDALSEYSFGPSLDSRPRRDLTLGYSLGKLFSDRMTDFLLDGDERYSLECIPAFFLAEINFLLGGNLCTYTSLINRNTPFPVNTPFHLRDASTSAMILDTSVSQNVGSFALPANTIVIRVIYNDPPETVRCHCYWESVQKGILSWTTDATSPRVRYIYEVHIYEAEKARDAIIRLQGGVTQALLDTQLVRFIEVDYDAFGMASTNQRKT